MHIPLRLVVHLCLAASLAWASQPVFSQVDEKAAENLWRVNDCQKCHSADRDKKGPALRKIAAKYQDDGDAVEKLVKHITTAPLVKLDDGTQEKHKVVKTRDKKAQANLIRWILGPASQIAIGGDAATGKQLAATACAECHGADGNSATPDNPKLAGIDAGYLLKQLQDFKAGTRPGASKASIGTLSDQDMDDLSVYYAGLQAAPGVVKEPTLLEPGKRVWEEGIPKNGVPACSGCHGDQGQGDERYPRLAAQHAEYTIAEMELFAAGKRTNDLRLMQTVANRMTEEEIRAVAEYIASLP